MLVQDVCAAREGVNTDCGIKKVFLLNFTGVRLNLKRLG